MMSSSSSCYHFYIFICKLFIFILDCIESSSSIIFDLFWSNWWVYFYQHACVDFDHAYKHIISCTTSCMLTSILTLFSSPINLIKEAKCEIKQVPSGTISLLMCTYTCTDVLHIHLVDMHITIMMSIMKGRDRER